MLQGVSRRKIFLYQAITLGFYYFYWCSRSRRDIIRSAGGKPIIPTTWALALPIGNYWWMWRYSNALDYVSYGRIKYADTFLLYIIALNLAFVGTPFFRVFPTFTNPSHREIIVAVLIFLVVMLITSIVCLGFFCAVMQDKISKLPKSAATAPPQH